jgi:hypothetical protein
MQNLLPTSTGGVAFAQPPATSLNPYRDAELKTVRPLCMALSMQKKNHDMAETSNAEK